MLARRALRTDGGSATHIAVARARHGHVGVNVRLACSGLQLTRSTLYGVPEPGTGSGPDRRLTAVVGLLELDGLSRRFGTVTALDELSFTVPAGQVVGFLGPNGAGKTTAMRAIFGLTDLDAGSVRWNVAPVGSAQRRRFGYMPEERGLYPTMLVAEQVEYLGRLHGMDAAAATSATTRWLERLEVADRATSKVEALSHGNQQRVQLAAALVHDPEVLVLDEPLAGLDPSGIDVIGHVLVEQAHAGCCVLFSSHQLDLVEDLCESVNIIDHGRLVARGTVDELATSGPRRLAVRVEGDRQGAWARGLPGVTVSEVNGGEVRLVLDDAVDGDMVLDAARAAGRVNQFVFERRRLSEVFREAVSR
jgi:ABC-2 type transport system ATP-binding protein